MSALSDYILTFNPYFYWQMADASGAPQDSSGNARHCDSAANLTYGITANVPAALVKSISCPSNGSFLRNAEYTGIGDQSWVLFWSPSFVTGSGVLHNVFSNGEFFSGARGMGITYNRATQKLRIHYSDSGGDDSAAVMESGTTPDEGGWVCLVLTYHDATATYTLYKNGVSVATVGIDVGQHPVAPTSGDEIGVQVMGGDSANTAPDGEYSHIFMVERVLTPTEVGLIHGAGINGAIPSAAGGMAAALLPTAIC